MKFVLIFLGLTSLFAVACSSGSSEAPGDAGASGGTGGGAGQSSGGTGGQGSGVGGAGSVSCPTCAATEICVAYRLVGGAALQPDAGSCPPGTHVEGSGTVYCLSDFSYRCVPLTGCTGGAPVSCACASADCPSGYSTCSDPQTADWLDPSAQLVCQLLAP